MHWLVFFVFWLAAIIAENTGLVTKPAYFWCMGFFTVLAMDAVREYRDSKKRD